MFLPPIIPAAQSTVAIGAPGVVPGLGEDTVTSSTPGTVLLSSLPGAMATPQGIVKVTQLFHLGGLGLCFFFSFLQRKGVKRQADTTTPSSGQPSPTAPETSQRHHHVITPAPLIPQRRESTRTIKRPNMDLPGETTCGRTRKRPLTVQLKYCQTVLKEMYNKKHQAYAWPFYYPVDAEKLGLGDYHEIIKTPMDLSTVKVSF